MFKTFGCPGCLSLVGHVMKWLESCLSVHHVVTYGHFILFVVFKSLFMFLWLLPVGYIEMRCLVLFSI